MSYKVMPVVLCGGSGSRLWPYSRAEYPKQFLSFSGSATLLQNATTRIGAVNSFGHDIAPPVLLCNEEHRFAVSDQLCQIGIYGAKIVLEPVSKNTAPAITLAALHAFDCDPETIILISPSDHEIPDDSSFAISLDLSIREAAKGAISLIGVVPSRPETGFGYIKSASCIGSDPDSIMALDVEEFVEKPDLYTAERYISDPNYFWNAGVLVVKAAVWLDLIKILMPELHRTVSNSWRYKSIDNNFIRPDKEYFSSAEDISADYAVIEKCKELNQALKVIPYNGTWSDLGAWDAVWSIGDKDDAGNVIVGDAIASNSKNNLIYAKSRLVVLSSLENLAVIETPDAILVSDRSKSQEIKEIVKQLSIDGRTEHVKHREVHRPWGAYDTLDKGPKFQVKKISVKPGGFLSLQKHRHRAEHWIVVQGTAEVTRGEDVFLLRENESTYIPLGVVHRLRNPTEDPLEIIEVQSGDYLGEDDIVRLDDLYGRQ